MNNTDNQHWANRAEAGAMYGILFLLWVYNLLGRRVFNFFCAFVMLYFFIVKSSARKASLDYLRRHQAYFANAKAKPSYFQVYCHLYKFAQCLLDKVSMWKNEITYSDVRFQDRADFNELLESKQGAMILSSHFGNIEVCKVLSELNSNLQLNILVHTDHATKFNKVLSAVDTGNRMRFFPVKEINPGTMIELANKIEAGEVVAIMGDRVPVHSDGKVVWQHFMGHKAPFPQGPFVLASLLKCPVYTLVCYKTNSKYTIKIEKMVDRVVLPRKERDEAMLKYVELYAKHLETVCELEPLQWFNFYNFWEYKALSK